MSQKVQVSSTITAFSCPLGANPPIPATRDLPVILSDREIRELLKVCVDLKEKALIGILCDTGMRTSEVLKLRLYDLDFDRSTVHIRDGKGHKDRYVPFSLNMQKVMRAYCKWYRPQDYVFEVRKGASMPPHWPAKVLSEVYFHVVFTLPDNILNSSMMWHRKEAYDALFAAAWKTLKAFADRAGVKMGMTAILHTRGSCLDYHVHLHCIVPAGGGAP